MLGDTRHRLPGANATDLYSVYRLFPNKADCIAMLEVARWGGEPICPYCASSRSRAIPAEYRYRCNDCFSPYSATVRTALHHTHIPLQKWFLVIILILDAARPIPSRRLAQRLGVNKDTAWSMQVRIRTALIESDQRALVLNIYERVKRDFR